MRASVLVPALVLLVPFAASAGDWVPPMPDAAAFRPAGPGSGVALDEKVREPGLSMLVDMNPAGLSAAASKARDWARGRGALTLSENGGAWRLADAQGESTALSAELGLALSRMNAYFGMAAPTLANPVSLEELQAALLSPAGVAAVQARFDKAFEEQLWINGKPFIPEIGGEASLDGTMRLNLIDDPTRPVLRQLNNHRDDVEALARIYAANPEQMSHIDKQGILKRHLETRRRWDAEGRLPRERKDAVLRMALDTVLELAAGHYLSGGAPQLEAMLSNDWSGRYVAPWHLHPPDAGPSGWLESNRPSEADYEAADKVGRELVLVFHPEGFDVYDVGAGGVNLDPPSFSHRSPAWRARFQAVYDRLMASRP